MSALLSPLRLATLHRAARRWFAERQFRFEAAPHPGRRQLLVDVSTIIRTDSRTGIQRVVRALLGQIMARESPGLKVQPVFASSKHGFCRATFQPDGRLINASADARTLQPVEVRSGDIFLGLDLTAQVLPKVESQLAEWRLGGVSINFVIYDVLPATQPHWFSARLARSFRRWLGVVGRQSDRCICISRAVASALADQFAVQGSRQPPELLTIPLGADLDASFPSTGLPEDFRATLDWAQRGRTVMTVGTIEPRKGHDLLLDAFDHIWQSFPGSDIALLIIGRPGWKTDRLQQRIRSHPEQGQRLVWLDQASDAYLAKLYPLCAGLVSASRAEGYGLPLIEAAAHGTPVLARDLPVFREVGGALFDYFDSDAAAPFAGRITAWLDHALRPSPADIAKLPRWNDSAAVLLAHLGLTTPEGVPA